MLNPFPTQGRIPSLDGWRALAILLVLGDHACYATGFPDEGWDWIGKVFHGNLGVRIFFVLSGFLISLLMLRETDKHGTLNLPRFWCRRIFRIFPVYFAYLGSLGILSIGGLYADSASSWIGSLSFTRNMVGQGKSATVHLWSLAVEEQFYLIWPLAFLLLKLWKRPALYLGLLIVPVLVCPMIRGWCISAQPGGDLLSRLFGERSILMYADSLAVGCIGAWFAWRLPNGGEWRRIHSGLWIGGIAVIGLSRWTSLGVGSFDALLPSIQALAIMGCIWLSASDGSPLYRLLNCRLLVILGLLSYSVYIWHVLFLGHFVGSPMQNWVSHDWRVWLVPSLLVAASSYHFLEMPVLKLRQKFNF